MQLERLEPVFSIGKLTSAKDIDLTHPFVFIGITDEEISLVCPKDIMPADALEVSEGWKGFRITGVLDFSLIGILSKISAVLADAKIGIFAVSTFNTDYIFVREEYFVPALSALERAGYVIV